MKRMVHLFFVALVTFLILKTTTFGWNLFSNSSKGCNPKDNIILGRIRKHIYMLSHKIGNRSVFYYDNLERAANYISEQFVTYGYKVEFQEYILENKKVKNIIAVKNGIKASEEIIVVGAHYDSCFNPGADDNASGVAGVLELARFMKDKDIDRTIKFIAFANEEPPYFKTENMGSRIYAREAKIKNEAIKAVIILETIGLYTNKINSQRYPIILGIFYPNKGNFITIVGNINSRHLVNKIKTSFRKYSKFPISSIALDFIPASDFSDHWSFWKEGYSAVMVTDTAFLRNFHYHRDSDTWEKLSYENMACVIEAFCSVLFDLAKYSN
ncbi:MAG: M20/M25/M40 family metallo-hydrolase [Candidatus Omnitrophota bacterium]|nr:M20/M25/M40 family metallo-hydrolase [Candidatus Omnitrophota bacterium]